VWWTDLLETRGAPVAMTVLCNDGKMRDKVVEGNTHDSIPAEQVRFSTSAIFPLDLFFDISIHS
jgi:hypothetical protein